MSYRTRPLLPVPGDTWILANRKDEPIALVWLESRSISSNSLIEDWRYHVIEEPFITGKEPSFLFAIAAAKELAGRERVSVIFDFEGRYKFGKLQEE